MSQREVGERMQLTSPQTNISNWENKYHEPGAGALERWAAALGAYFTITEKHVDTTREGE